MRFTGEFEHTIDSKHRLAIPADLRTVIDQAGHGNVLYLVPWGEGSIWIFPEPVFDRLADHFSDIMAQGEDALEFESILFPLARRVEMDSAGRIRVPQAMLDDAGLESAVMILGRNDRMEIASRERWAMEREEKRRRFTEFFKRTRLEFRGKKVRGQEADGNGNT